MLSFISEKSVCVSYDVTKCPIPRILVTPRALLPRNSDSAYRYLSFSYSIVLMVLKKYLMYPMMLLLCR